MLAFLSLTTPLLLGGLGLLAFPVLAHWLHRRSRRTIVFPSIALLVETAARQSQFHRLKRWLLLALRLLAVACIVFAFTRPVWQTSDADAALPDDAAAAVVVVLDLSPSTGQQVNGVSELETLKGEVGRILDDLSPGLDVAGVVVADGAPRSLFPRLSANTSGLRTAVSDLKSGHERADFPAALATAGKLLSDHKGARRLVILSDLQRSNWGELLSDGKPGELLPRGTVIHIGPRPQTVASNVALSRPRHFPALPLTGEPFDVTVQVSNFSDAVRQLRLTCDRTAGDGAAAALGHDELTVALAAREERDVTFHVAALESDRQLVRIEALAVDGLAIDNVAWLVVETIARTPVVVLSDDDPRAPGSAAYYLTRALAPSVDASSRFEPRSLRSTQLTREALSGAPVVVVGYLGALSAEAAAALDEFAREGGGLVIFSGEGPVDRSLQSLDAASGPGQFLPWSPGPRRTMSVGREPIHLGNGRWQSRWLRAFDEQSQFALQQIQFERVWSAGAISPAAEVLLNFVDGTPALGVRGVEQGIVVVANFSPESTTSDLARHGAFVAFTQMLVQASIPEATAQGRPVVGQAWNWRGTFAGNAARDFTAIGPDGKPVPLSSLADTDRLTLSVPRLSQPGLYQLRDRGSVVEAVAVTLDERESNLERITAADIERRFSITGGEVVVAASDGSPPPLRGRPLWGVFLSAALAALGLELLLLGWWRR